MFSFADIMSICQPSSTLCFVPFKIHWQPPNTCGDEKVTRWITT